MTLDFSPGKQKNGNFNLIRHFLSVLMDRFDLNPLDYSTVQESDRTPAFTDISNDRPKAFPMTTTDISYIRLEVCPTFSSNFH